MCEIGAIIAKNEQFARGWLRLYEKKCTPKELEEIARYIMLLTKHYHQHLDRCLPCAAEYDAKYPPLPGSAA